MTGLSGVSGSAPGGAGGGAANTGNTGGNGAAGQVTLTYASSGVPNNVVVRFLLDIPAKSTPANNAVLLRAVISSGTLSKIECWYTTASGGGVAIVGTGGAGFSSSSVTGVNGVQLMVSLELMTSGSNLNWKIDTIQPGAAASFGSQSGTMTTATIGAVSQVLVSPNSDINDTAIGHIVVQYALEALTVVSPAINGHIGELATDRFSRLCSEEGFTGTPVFSEGTDHFGFESGTQSWTGASNCTVAQSTYAQLVPPDIWPTEGTHSLAITPSTNAAFYTESPAGTAGIPVSPFSYVSVSADASGTGGSAAILSPYVAIEWFNSGGTSVGVTTGTTGGSVSSGINDKLTVSGIAPSTAAFFAVRAGGSGYSSLTSMVIDNVTIGPVMGPQLDDTFTNLLQTIEDADRGQLIEARDMLGLYYRTRVSLRNQTPALTLNYPDAVLANKLQPVYDDQLTRNDIAITRPNGSTAAAVQSSGNLSVQAPPNGVGDYTYTAQVYVRQDLQLANLAAWILTLGTVDEYRYPVIEVDLTRSEVAGAGLFDSTPALDVGGYVQITNPPSQVPESPVKQLAWGFTETLGQYLWDIAVNAVPETPYDAALNANILAYNSSTTGWNTGGTGGAITSLSGTAVPAGALYPFALKYVTTGAPSGEKLFDNSEAFAITTSTQYYNSAWVWPQVTGGTVTVGFDWRTSSGSLISGVTTNKVLTNNTWNYVQVPQTSPSNVTAVKGNLNYNLNGLAGTIIVQHAVATPDTDWW